MRFPLLYEINTRAYLNGLSSSLGRPATLDDFPAAEIEAIAANGFHWVWLLSVWQLGEAGRRVALSDPAARERYLAVLPDLRDDDIVSSGFAIVDYVVARDLGGPEALARLRARFAAAGLRLMLDFVPNHMALDAAWLDDHPEYFVRGTPDAIARAPQNYQMIHTGGRSMILAHGRDPNFDGWTDTLQLDYTNPGLQQAQHFNLLEIAEQCDGVRADMAMLLLPDVFERTWGLRPEPFWPSAIAEVKRDFPEFTFMAEVYWDLEAVMQGQGFDYAYDKRLYDRLRTDEATPVRDHLALASVPYQSKLARFLENHDEARAASTFPLAQHEAAGIVTYLTPGLRFFFAGQLTGARARLPMQVVRAPAEAVNAELQDFYARLLEVLRRPVVHAGEWQALPPLEAWAGNATFANYVTFAWQLIPYVWETAARARLVVAVNFSDERSQCRLRIPFDELRGRTVEFVDTMGNERYERDGSEVVESGLFVDLAPWHWNVFEVNSQSSS